MMKIFKKLIILMIFMFSGCYNYSELNRLALASSIAIDKVADQYEVTFQIINTQKEVSGPTSSGVLPKIVVFSAKGKTIQEAMRNISLEIPKKIYVGHIDLLVFGDTIAKEGIKDVLDFLFRDPEFRKQFIVVVCKNNSGKDAIEILTLLQPISSKKILDMIKTNDKYLGTVEMTTFEQLVNMYLNKKTEIVIPAIEILNESENKNNIENIEDSTPKSRLLVSGMAVFKEDKLLGYATKQESNVINIVKNKSNIIVVNYECKKDKYMEVEVIGMNSAVKVSSNKPKVAIDITGEGLIAETNCDIDLGKEKSKKEISKKVSEKLQKKVSQAISDINNKYNSDIYGFLDLFYRANPKYYKKIEKEWYKKIFKNLDIDVKVNIEIVEKGNILKEIRR